VAVSSSSASLPPNLIVKSSSIDSNTTDVVKSSPTTESTTSPSRLSVDPQIAIDWFYF